MLVGETIKKWLSLESAADITERIAVTNQCRTALDVGCGSESPFTRLRPGVTTVGIDTNESTLLRSKQSGAHDYYIEADILKDDIRERLPAETGIGRVDIVGLIGVIEHLPKQLGYELLARCEEIADKFVVLETPNGFVPQGPEFGNEHQRHLSGWFIHDFEGLGYSVVGTTGTRYLRGQAAGLKYPYRGVGSIDVLLARALRADRNPRHAFNLFAYKDIRGVPAILG